MLLEKALDRDWHCIVQAPAERLKALDDLLWAYAADGFLPHGLDPEPDNPIFLTDKPGNPNGAKLRIFVDGEKVEAAEPYDRMIVIFDGNDENQLSNARQQWKALKQSGASLAYWQQNDNGGWEKKA